MTAPSPKAVSLVRAFTKDNRKASDRFVIPTQTSQCVLQMLRLLQQERTAAVVGRVRTTTAVDGPHGGIRDTVPIQMVPSTSRREGGVPTIRRLTNHPDGRAWQAEARAIGEVRETAPRTPNPAPRGG